MTRLQLNESAQVTLDANGNGTARCGPGRAGVRWDVRTVAINCSSARLPQAELFLGDTPAAGASLASTHDGSLNSTDIQVTLYSGHSLSVHWAGGDPGAIATMSILGSNVIGEG